MRMVSTGGEHHPSLWTSTRSRTYGTNSKNTLRHEVKPTTKQQLTDGIQAFWKTVDVDKCTKYIHHLRKVIPQVVELKGAATGF